MEHCDWLPETSSSASTPPSGGRKAGGRGSRGACTLLGPEGSDTGSGPPGSGIGFSDSCRTSGRHACGSGEYRPYVENYTVDASIFLVENITTSVVVCSIEENNVRHRIMNRYGPSGSSGSDVGGNHWSSPLQEVPSGHRVWWVRFILMYVVKFERANGGCLGNWSRRRT